MIKKILKQYTPNFLLSWYHYALAFLGAVIYWFPSKKLIVIGVTGTSGKSTTVDFITKILEGASHRVASASSVRFKIGDKEWKNELKMTMPGRFAVQQFLRQAADAGCKYVVLEVTSEGIRQYRHKFINFTTVVFTNLSPEHIESHGGFEQYRHEKIKLFKVGAKNHIINGDDEHAEYFLRPPAKQKTTFGIHGNVDVKAQQVAPNNNGTGFSVAGVRVQLAMLGEFNVYNALAAITVAIGENVSLEICKKALESAAGIPGRMEIVRENPLVVVDYAHTPVQLELAYKSLGGRPLVCVLGSCGGGRDKWKRSVLGSVAQTYCKEIIITNEDPYDEDPLSIMEQVAAGIEPGKSPENFHIILDRKEAISRAIMMARPGDAVMITGKGSEPLMCLADGKKIPWSDREVVLGVVASAK